MSSYEKLFIVKWSAMAYGKYPDPISEYRFHPHRRWRFDFAWPADMLAVEIEGGQFIRGRHQRPTGFAKDCEKYNAAAAMGWRVLRYPGHSVEKNFLKIFCEILELLK